MTFRRRVWLPAAALLAALLVLAAGAACRRAPSAPSAPSAESIPVTATADSADSLRPITILYTNDEHGWMLGMQPGSGAAELVGLWRTAHGYRPDDDRFLVLSGGDMWTGPAVSTWFDGESMADVLNTMGYDAAAVGNHEFDFGLDILAQRAAMSAFPFVSANVRRAADNQVPTDLGIVPYVIQTHNGIQVAVIGLTTRTTPTSTHPQHVRDFVFINYADALAEVVPQARADGAELIVVAGHICGPEMALLSPKAAALGVHVLGGGHCNERIARQIAGVINLEGGFHLTAYAYATLTFDTATDTVVDATYGVADNVGGTPDPQVFEVVQTWAEAADAALDTVIGHLARPIERRSPTMQALITETWLLGVDSADIAVTNLGGMRATLAAGDITLGDIITVMPFDNVLVQTQLTGAEFIATFGARSDIAIAGVRRAGVRWIVNATGERLDPDATYSVLVNDFMYAGGDDFTQLAEFDPNGYNTAIDWRQPLIDWIIDAQSDADQPLDAAIDALSP